ncbi:hypothetical protein QBC47DRAFT_390060 [Echria macrotheca]|uniref:Uncharacterized protein n=1 Tax=Echria macrotheca TaxID=438768 RepID=A0AAJ0F8L2_9PEZI|nr:hypothetical protein QBC47DRAFT_390060 [Echria macrotheca]
MYLSRTWFSAGYPESVANGEVLVRADDITIESAAVSNTEGNETLTLPFAAHGWSGGPLYGVNSASGDAELIGVVSSFRTVSAQGTVVNSAVNSGGPMLAQLIAWARCRWPGDPSELVGC